MLEGHGFGLSNTHLYDQMYMRIMYPLALDARPLLCCDASRLVLRLELCVAPGQSPALTYFTWPYGCRMVDLMLQVSGTAKSAQCPSGRLHVDFDVYVASTLYPSLSYIPISS